MATNWNKRTRIEETVGYDSSFSYDSPIPYSVSYFGDNWDKRTPINIPLRQENSEYIMDDYGNPIYADMTVWNKRTRIDTKVGYDSPFSYDSSTPYDVSYEGNDWTTRPNI